MSKPLGIWFGAGDGDMESGSPLDRGFLIALFCLGLAILATRKLNWPNVLKENIWLMLLLGYMLISIYWSPIQFISLKRWSRELVAVVMAFIMATESDPRQALQSIFRRTIYVLIPFSYILIHYFPEYGREYGRWSGVQMWIGVAMQKNGLARLCLIAAVFLIWSFIRRRQGKDIPVVKYQTFIELFLLILTLWFMGGPQHNFSYSATTNVAFIIGLSMLFCLLRMKKRDTVFGQNVMIILALLIIAYGTITPMIGRLSVVDVSSTFGRDESLTGRSEIWAVLVPLAKARPLLGYGVGGFWTTKIRELTSSDAHNGYLDMILNFGFFGLLLFVIFLLSCVRKAQRVMTTQDFDWGALWICFLFMTFIHNIAESSIAGFTSPLSAIILFLAVNITHVEPNLGVSEKTYAS